MESGQCAKCGSENLAYDTVEIETGFLYYPYKCMDCQHEGKEFYNIEYTDSE